MLLLGLFIALFVLGYVMYSAAKKCTYKYNSWLYDFLYNHDSEVSILGICIMVISGTAILIWLLFYI
jgi:hypothetical protein